MPEGEKKKLRCRRMAASLSLREYFGAICSAPRDSRLPVARGLASLLFSTAAPPANVEVCEFHSLDEYPLAYARLANLLGCAEQVPPIGEIEFLRSVQNRGIHYPGAIGISEYLFLTGFAGILAPTRSIEIGTSTGFSSALIAAALQRRHPQREGPFLDTIDLHTRYLVDQTKMIGFEIPDLLPDFPHAVRVHTSRDSEFVRELAGEDELAFAFIDADHQHPLPLLDLLRVAPFVRPGGWIVLHDIQLGTMGARARKNGAPFPYGTPYGAEWLFDKWPFPKINGGNIGAVQLPKDKTQIIPTALKLIALPFEMNISSHRRMRHAVFQSLLKLIK